MEEEGRPSVLQPAAVSAPRGPLAAEGGNSQLSPKELCSSFGCNSQLRCRGPDEAVGLTEMRGIHARLCLAFEQRKLNLRQICYIKNYRGDPNSEPFARSQMPFPWFSGDFKLQ